MKKFTKKDYLNLLLIILIIFIYVILETNFFEYVYGSIVDWDCQHWIIPEYFRNLFYSTKEILPNFAFNIGNGQNIFYLSYYGLLSPVILISYLFPFVEMIDYMQIISIVGLITSSILLYKWIYDKYDSKIAFLSTISFTTLAPLLFHTHRHLMFVNYMPFLIMALMSTDKYFKTNSKSSLIISIFLIVMTSYFFSVSAIVSIVIYGICLFIEKTRKITLKEFFKEGFKFLTPIIIGILMSSIIIIPTFYIIFNGRSKTNVEFDLLNLFIPNFKINKLFYSTYSIGLTAVSFVALIINLLKGRKKDKALSIFILILLSFPIFTYILNGTMYVDYKVFITFTPLLTLQLATFIKEYEKKIDTKLLIITCIIGIILYFFNMKYDCVVYLVDLSIVIILLIIGNKIKKKNILLTCAIIFSSLVSLGMVYQSDTLYTKEELNKIENTTMKNIFSKINKDDNIYRITNQNYKLQNINRVPTTDYYISTIYSSTSNNLYKEYFYNYSGNEITERTYGKINSSYNIFYNLANANKYLIAEKNAPVGYTNIKDKLYVNNDVLPIIYSSSNLMNKKEYEKLEFPYNMEAQLKYIIVEDDIKTNYETKIEEYHGELSLVSKSENIDINKENNTYNINVEGKGEINLYTEDLLKDEILIIKFDLENNKKCPGDLSITINGIENVLTCKSWKYHNKNTEFNYVISSNEIIKKLNIILLDGTYNISNLKLYKVKYNDINNVREEIDEFNFDNKKISDVINGTIRVKKEGYLYMSIPYDTGFKIYLNDKEYDYEIVDNAFIGVKVDKGFYNVKIVYESPLLKESIAISGVFGVVFIIIFTKERKKIKKHLILNKK